MAAYREPMKMEARSPESAQPHSPWHSPVPYLFGGLAAMLGLIAFALLILACSYWKLSGYLDGSADGERDLEAGELKNDDETHKEANPPAYEHKFLVIMAGHDKPTCLATPMFWSRSSSLAGDNTSTTCTCHDILKSVEMAETVKQGSGGSDQVQHGNMETRDTSADHNC